MVDKPVPTGPPDPEVQDVLDMLALEGRHEGHTLRRIGQWWLCSCSKEVQKSA